jgi:hypothetical protein
MPLPMYTSSEKPSTSETKVSDQTAHDSAPATSTSTNENQTAGGAIGGTKSEAELAAEKLYEERMEEEYAKREGGA